MLVLVLVLRPRDAVWFVPCGRCRGAVGGNRAGLSTWFRHDSRECLTNVDSEQGSLPFTNTHTHGARTHRGVFQKPPNGGETIPRAAVQGVQATSESCSVAGFVVESLS